MSVNTRIGGDIINTIAAGALALLLASANMTVISEEVKPGAPEVRLGQTPRIVESGVDMRLDDISSEMGDKLYSGSLRSGRSVKVIQFENPSWLWH